MSEPPGSGVRTPQFRRVRGLLDTTVGAMSAVPSAKRTLVNKFKEKEWLAIRDKAEGMSEEDVVGVALERIKEDVENFDLFVDMIHDTIGMDYVYKKLTGRKLAWRKLGVGNWLGGS